MKYEINPSCKMEFRDFLTNIKNYFDNSKSSIHKARNELKVIPYKDTNTIVKSFKIPNILNKIIYTFFRDSKAKKSYDNSIKLADFTPTPIGYIEYYKNSLLNESYFISEQFHYDFTIREPLLDKSFHNREDILKAFAKFTAKLHDAGVFHDDYSPGNILIKKDATDYIFKIVDVNRMKFFPLKENDRAKNFSKLWANENDLTLIAQEYLKYFPSNKNFIQKVLHYSMQNKKRKNFKKRLKGQSIDW